MRKRTLVENEEKPAGLMTNPVWKFLSSLKLALVLMLVLVALSLIGTFLIQVPLESTQNAEQYNYWLENVARPETGVWYPFLLLMGFFNVFHSVWFLGAGFLLLLSIIICTLNRWKQIKTTFSLKPPVKNTEYYLSSDPCEIKTSLPSDEVRLRLSAVFKRNRYTLKQENADGTLYVVADKNRFSSLGTYLVHLSLILFIIGFLIGSYLGFRDPSFIVAEGETKAVGNGTGLSLNLQSFIDEYWENGSPKDYRSRVTILENGREVKQGTVQVNHPLSYKGIRFYQSFFGDTARLDIKDVQGKSLFTGSVLLSQTLEDAPYLRPAGSIQTTSSGYTVYIVGRAKNTVDTELASNQIGIEIYQGNSSRPVVATRLNADEPYKSANLVITYSGSGKYSGFQVSRDPGNSLIWISSAIFLLGLIVVFYFPRRQICLMLQSGFGNLSGVYLRSGMGRKMGSETEIRKLEAAIKKELV